MDRVDPAKAWNDRVPLTGDPGKGGERAMTRDEWEYACGFCRKAFRSLNGKLRHLKVCKELLPDDKRSLPLTVDPPRRAATL